jgi:hypothetical protein
MNMQTKIYIAAGVIAFAIAVLGVSGIWSDHKIASVTRAVEEARKTADEKTKLAAEKETESAAYKEKNEYLETRIAEIQVIARKQDEELEKFKTDTAGARSDVERARRVRSIASTSTELCAKLAEVGHACR